MWGGRLYATGCNAATDTEIWEYDGINWSQVNMDGFGDVNNTIAPAMAVFNDNLYVGTKNLTTGCEVWEYDGSNWSQVNTDGFGSGSGVAFSMAVFRNKLYVGTFNPSGAEVWAYDGSDWTLVNTPGFGDANNLMASSITALSGDLYVGTRNFVTGSEVWRYEAGQDADGDGLTNQEEIETYSTNPNNPDSDGDGYSDGEEVNWHPSKDPNNPGEKPQYSPGYYYTSSDNPLWGDGTQGNPWNLHTAIHHINEGLLGSPGEGYTLHVAGGIYSVTTHEPDEKLIITRDNVTVLGKSGSMPVLDGTGAGSDEDTDWGIGIETSGNEIIIENIEVCNFSYWEGILIEGNNTTIVDCNVHDNAVGIAFDDVEHNVGGNVKTCNVHDNAAEGISVVDAQDVLIEECEVYGNGASGYDSGIYLKHADVSINLNTIHANSSCGIAVEDCSPLIEKNDIHDNA